MQVQELKRLLERFPQTAEIEIQGPSKQMLDLDHVEMAFDMDPIALGDKNLAWSEMVQDRIKARFITSAHVKGKEWQA